MNTQNKMIINDNNITFYINNETQKYVINIKELIKNNIKLDKILDENIIEKIIRICITNNDYNFNLNNIVTLQYYLLDEEINITINLNIKNFENNYNKIFELNQEEKDNMLINLFKKVDKMEKYINIIMRKKIFASLPCTIYYDAINDFSNTKTYCYVSNLSNSLLDDLIIINKIDDNVFDIDKTNKEDRVKLIEKYYSRQDDNSTSRTYNKIL